MPMPACVASRRTVPTSQASSALAGWVMTRAPVDRLAMNLDMASEMSEPPKPENGREHQQAAQILARCWPGTGRCRAGAWTPTSTASTAILVARNSRIRFTGHLRGPGPAAFYGSYGAAVSRAALLGYLPQYMTTEPTPDAPQPLTRFWQPRYWPIWLGLGWLRLVSLLPVRSQLAVGRGLGRLIYWATSRAATHRSQ